MSYTYYPQYVDFSNPATRRVYNWEVASTTSEQDAAFQLQQDPQQSAQEHEQPQHISPSQHQLQQLPPLPLPAHQHQQHSASGSPQDSEHIQLQQLLQPRPHLQMQQQQLPPHHQTIQVAPAQAQPRYRFETVTEEDFIHASATGERPRSSRRRGASKAPLHVDASHASSSSSTTVPAASLGPSGGAHAHSAGGPWRIPHPRAHVQSAHPYRRPRSRAASGSGAQAPVRSHGVSELQDTEAAPTQGGQRLPAPLEHVRRYSIRADVHYSAEDNVMTAMLELPGVKKGDVRIAMSVCPFSRVRQLSISGLSRAVLPLQGHSVRERKFGEFFRTVAVPPETKCEDISVTFEDGILTLKVPCGAPAQAEQPEDVPIP